MYASESDVRVGHANLASVGKSTVELSHAGLIEELDNAQDETLNLISKLFGQIANYLVPPLETDGTTLAVRMPVVDTVLAAAMNKSVLSQHKINDELRSLTARIAP